MISPQKRFAIQDLGAALVASMTPQMIADLLTATLCHDDDERLTDYQSELIGILFDRLVELKPEAVDLAIGLDPATGNQL